MTSFYFANAEFKSKSSLNENKITKTLLDETVFNVFFFLCSYCTYMMKWNGTPFFTQFSTDFYFFLSHAVQR